MQKWSASDKSRPNVRFKKSCKPFNTPVFREFTDRPCRIFENRINVLKMMDSKHDRFQRAIRTEVQFCTRVLFLLHRDVPLSVSSILGSRSCISSNCVQQRATKRGQTDREQSSEEKRNGRRKTFLLCVKSEFDSNVIDEVIYNLKNRTIQEFQHYLESKSIEVMIQKMLSIQFVSTVNLIQI
jgi:hypothetical protein